MAVALARRQPMPISINSGRPLVFWLVTLALLASAAVLLREVLLPFVAGLALAYLLDPLVNRLERIGINRALATLLILVTFFASVILVLLLTAPLIVGEIALLIDKLPGYVKRLQALALDPGHPTINKIVKLGLSDLERSGGEVASVGASWLTAFMHSLWSDGRMLLSVFSLLVVTPIITAYLVYDWNRLVGAVDQLVPVAQRTTVRMVAREVNDTVADVLRGQGTICLILVVFYAVALRALGLEHGLLIGLISGLLSLIPYFGSLTGLMLSLVVALLQFGPTWTPILLIVGVFLVGQSLADYVLAPYLVGSRVHLNPVWLMFALFSFGYLFGFVGLLIAVPLAASIGVLVRFALRQNATAVPRGSAAAEFGPPVDGENPLVRPPLQ
jgi:predicted PurR-regulated permease PerM